MTPAGRRVSPCAACGHPTVFTLCRRCVRAGYRAASLWCDCDVPEPDPNGVCSTCSRWVEGVS